MAVSQLVGARVKRREDPRLVTGHGHFTDDFTRVGVAHVAFVRSPHPPAVINVEKAAQPNSDKVHIDAADNICWDLPFAGNEVSEAAFKSAEVVVKERIHQQRLTPTPMETRGVLADYEAYDKRLTMWMSTQNPHFIRLFVSGAMGLQESLVRVISADVGGGFGSKISPYPEDYLVPAVSRLLGRPVKWIESRTESVQNAYAGRGQYYDVEVAAKKAGTLLGLRVPH